jgi:hypothetical protein
MAASAANRKKLVVSVYRDGMGRDSIIQRYRTGMRITVTAKKTFAANVNLLGVI